MDLRVLLTTFGIIFLAEMEIRLTGSDDDVSAD